MAGSESKLHRTRGIGPSSGVVDPPLVIYGLVTGILAVGAGALVSHAEPHFGALARAGSLLTTVAISLVAALFARSGLEWFLRGARDSDHPGQQ